MDKALVAALLELKADMDAAIERSFGGNDSFATALRSVLEACINARADKPAELMAKFIDSKMRGGGKGGSGGGGDLDIELLLDRVMALFRCIHGKDVFEAFYKKVRRQFCMLIVLEIKHAPCPHALPSDRTLRSVCSWAAQRQLRSKSRWCRA